MGMFLAPKSIRFTNYKALRDFSVSLKQINILTGPNNGGKSTIIGALRILSEGLRQARSKTTSMYTFYNEQSVMGWIIPKENISVSLENIHTDYEDNETFITFSFGDDKHIYIRFDNNGTCVMTLNSFDGYLCTPKAFNRDFPIRVKVLPVLGPIEKEEKILTKAFIKSGFDTNLASRHFRNFWFHFPEQFERFAELIRTTWPGMEIGLPERSGYSDNITMFVSEKNIDREIFWSGFGFQIWCQILTHIASSDDADIVVIDEPEIYLHPEIQRQLLSILRDRKSVV